MIRKSQALYPGRGRGAAWEVSETEIDLYVRYILSWKFGHEDISITIISLPLIQDEKLSVDGERMYTKSW